MHVHRPDHAPGHETTENAGSSVGTTAAQGEVTPKEPSVETLRSQSRELYTFLRQMEEDWHARLADHADPANAAANFVGDWSATTRDRFDALFASMSAEVDALPGDELRAEERHVRGLLQPYFFLSAFCRRVIDWPCGYPGDYRTVEMIFSGREVSSSPIGTLLGNYALQCGPCEAHRGRAVWTHAQIARWTKDTGETRPRILSFACGPEVVLRRWIQAGGEGDLTLADHDPHALAHAERLLRKVTTSRQNTSTVQTRRVSAFDLDESNAAHLLVDEQPFDVATVLGLLDYLDDVQTVAFLRALCATIRPGGRLLVSNVSGPNPWRALMETVGGWRVVHRSPERLAVLLTATERLGELDVTVHESGTNVYVAATRL
jgi:SAM-dependent methyltransferase